MIIVDSITPVEHSKGSVRSKYTLFADTKAEVPSTGTATKALISGLSEDLPPTTIIHTGDWKVAKLLTDDNWSWKEE